MKLPLLASAALLLVTMSASAAPASPVGTWELALSGDAKGLAYMTFEDDRDFTAYGISDLSLGVFTISGTWSIDDAGQLSGSYTESSNGGSATGSFSGRLSGRKLTGSITASNGAFKFKGRPETDVQDLTGSWTGIAQVRGLRLPEVYLITPSALPHVFEVSGTGYSPLGEFAITGSAIAGSGGRLRIVAFSQYPFFTQPGVTNLAGTADAGRKLNWLKGFESTGEPIRLSLKR